MRESKFPKFKFQNIWLLGYVKGTHKVQFMPYFISPSTKTSKKGKANFLCSSLFSFRFKKYDSSEFLYKSSGGTTPLPPPCIRPCCKMVTVEIENCFVRLSTS